MKIRRVAAGASERRAGPMQPKRSLPPSGNGPAKDSVTTADFPPSCITGVSGS
jgi:hypothetical protein